MLLAAIVANAEYDSRCPARAAALHEPDQPLPVATAGVAYRAALQASGGTPPYTYSVVGLPVGLTSSGSTIDGTTFAPGTTFVSLTARDAAGRTSSCQVALSIAGPLLPRVEMFAPDAGDLDTGVLTTEGNNAYRFTR